MKVFIFFILIFVYTFSANIEDNSSMVVKLAKSKLGSQYSYGKAGENSFDCSGFVYYVFRENGYKIARTSKAQSKMNKPIIYKKSNLKVGDILFFDTSDRGYVNHSGIYIGNMKFIHATSGKAHSVTISRLDKGFYQDRFLWAIRVINP